MATDEETMLLWGRQSLPSFTYTIQQPIRNVEKLKILQDRSACSEEAPDVPSHGHVVWDAAIVLADYLQQLATTTDLCDCRALELGAGIGLVGMTLAALGCKKVMLTDQAYCLPLLHCNVQANFASESHDRHSYEAIQVQELQWGVQEDLQAVGAVDLLVASDVLYNANVHGILIDTIASLSTAKTVVLLAYETRQPALEAGFKEQLQQAGFVCRIVPFLSQQVDYPEDIVLLEARRDTSNL